MPSFPLLDVAIGLIFVYLLLSLISSSLNELLESILRNRANDLEAGIRNLLGDKQPGSWWRSFLPFVNSLNQNTITKEFYNHPLIRNLFETEKRLPTYIPARNFALAIMDLAVPNAQLIRGATAGNQKVDPSTISFAKDETENSRLTKSISALVTAANGDAQQARLNVENWFNSSMDRVSGGYKSRTQKILFCLGLVVTVLVNADSIELFRNLAHSKNLEAVVGAASSTVAGKLPAGVDPQAQIGKAMDELNGLNLGLGWTKEAEQSGKLDRAHLAPSLDVGACVTETWPCKDPIGWSLHLLWLHVLGWLITAAAISLGAPFWFDTLNRFMIVRSTVKPKEKSSEERSKDPVPGP